MEGDDESALTEGLYYDVKGDLIECFEDFGNSGHNHNEANQGLVSRVRGITSNWKQSILF